MTDAELRDRLTTALGADAGGSSTRAAADAAAAPCESDVRAAEPALGALRLEAALRFDDQPAHVLVFDLGTSIRAYVLADTACTDRLASITLPSP